MIGFKPIDDFTFDDCVRSLERFRAEGKAPDEELLNYFNTLLEKLRIQERKDFTSDPSIKGLENYIQKYTSLAASSKYQPQFLDKAKDELSRLKKLKKSKRRKRIAIFSGSIFIILIVLIIIGYKPVKIYQPFQTITLSKDAIRDTIPLNLDAPYVYLDTYVPYDNWLDVERHGRDLILRADKNWGERKSYEISIVAYPALFDITIPWFEKRMTVYIEQKEGFASFLRLSQDSIELPPEGGTCRVQVETDGHEWSYEGAEHAHTAGGINVDQDGSQIIIEGPYRTSGGELTKNITVYSDNIRKELKIVQARFSAFRSKKYFTSSSSTFQSTYRFYSDGTCYETCRWVEDRDWISGRAEGRYYIYKDSLYIKWDECEQQKFKLYQGSNSSKSVDRYYYFYVDGHKFSEEIANKIND